MLAGPPEEHSHLEAALALDVHEEAVGGLDKPFRLVFLLL